MSNKDEAAIQQQYYAKTAQDYDEMHLHEGDEHFFALSFFLTLIDVFGLKSILDIGSGTGRAILYLKENRPDIRIVGVEPVTALREIGYQKGILRHELIDGDATKLDFGSGDFDAVCEFGMLHHIKNPEKAVAEMLRVAKKAIFISDSNSFGQGTILIRAVKQSLNALGLWKVADFIKTGGKGYSLSEGDGLAYSYSVFNNYQQIRNSCESIHVLNTQGIGVNPYRNAGHVALLGVKK